MRPRNIKVFIACPGDCDEQRRVAVEVIHELDEKLRSLFDVRLQSVSWKTFRPDVIQGCDRDVQDPITRRLDKCHVVIGILAQRYGRKLPRKKISGTHEELRFALDHSDRISLLTYYNKWKNPKKPVDPREAFDLENLKEELTENGVLHKSFYPRDFRRVLTLDLMEAILELVTEAKRRTSLNDFFRLGRRRDQTDPSILIAYPPIHQHYGSTKKKNYNWQKRLVPNVVYDDFKAIQKLESALDCLGIAERGAITVPHHRLVDQPGNRIWLCLPRNDLAQDCHAELGGRAWFHFEDDPDTEVRTLHWTPPGKAPVTIRSPLVQYLSRSRPPKKSAWDPDYGYIVARDFAILARFAVRAPNGQEPFYHYYLAGIRGLGTWGAGWFVDRHYEELARVSEQSGQDDVQMLLDVRFKDYRIHSVDIVTDEPQEYFDRANSEELIEKEVRSHPHPRGAAHKLPDPALRH